MDEGSIVYGHANSTNSQLGTEREIIKLLLTLENTEPSYRDCFENSKYAWMILRR
jgi:hypothetical protein